MQIWLIADDFIIIVHGILPIDVIVEVLFPVVQLPLLTWFIVACIETLVAGITVLPLVIGETSCSVIFHEDNPWVSVHIKPHVDQLAINDDKLEVYCPISQYLGYVQLTLTTPVILKVNCPLTAYVWLLSNNNKEMIIVSTTEKIVIFLFINIYIMIYNKDWYLLNMFKFFISTQLVDNMFFYLLTNRIYV